MVDPARFGAVQPVTPVRPRDTIATQTQRSAAQTPAQQTSLPQLLNIVAELVTHGPPVDHAKIAQIRQAIASTLLGSGFDNALPVRHFFFCTFGR